MVNINNNSKESRKIAKIRKQNKKDIALAKPEMERATALANIELQILENEIKQNKETLEETEKASQHNESNTKLIITALLPYVIMFSITFMIIFVSNRIVPTAFVSGSSMYPTLKNGNLVTCNKDISVLERGDIIVYKMDGKRVIKRIIAVPGDKITIKNGQPVVNGKTSEYTFEDIEDAGILANEMELELLDDQYFCMGDNRNASTDCRFYGAVYKSQIIFKVKNTYSFLE